MSGMADKQADGAAILVVEDEVMLLMVVAETLRDAGFTVLEASNGTMALQALKEHPEIGLMISDIKMPGMSGYEVAQEGLMMRPELKIVLMTGYAQDPMPARFAEANVQLLYKPFNFDLLPGLAKTTLGS
ncbi:MAG TPA: response regulator [Micropepsaceae bacterium]|nr:response regulator [Micropepsaceae bacterium]